MTIYTEADFHACLLVHGWTKHHSYTDNNISFTYWQSVDNWFEKVWPERFIPDQREWVDARDNPRCSYEGQMEFKIQFWTWGRKLFDLPAPISHRTKGAPKTGL